MGIEDIDRVSVDEVGSPSEILSVGVAALLAPPAAVRELRRHAGLPAAETLPHLAHGGEGLRDAVEGHGGIVEPGRLVLVEVDSSGLELVGAAIELVADDGLDLIIVVGVLGRRALGGACCRGHGS